jgi:hypothetical protein
LFAFPAADRPFRRPASNSSTVSRCEQQPVKVETVAAFALNCEPGLAICLRMKLPNAAEAVVERAKIVEYLLNPEHRYGASKARFFSRFGFQAQDWEQLAQALLSH